jgi:PhnB protein
VHIPEGFGTMFPYVFVNKAHEYIQFLRQAFGAEEIGRSTGPNGEVANARIKIGTTRFMISEATEPMSPTRGTFYLYVENADTAMSKAVSSGGTKMFDPMDMPYQDRQGGVIDPAGNIWWISQRLVTAAYD